MKALICGVNGQDGSYLAKLLLAKGYSVYGTSRDAQTSSRRNLKALGIDDSVEMLSMAGSDFRSVLNALQYVDPDEVYYLAGQSSVGLSFEQPVETLDSFTTSVLNLLETIRFLKKDIRFYNASSSESFGDTPKTGAIEDTPFRPRSPYAVAKASAHWLVSNYREAYGLYACNGILFNHESPLRPSRFVTHKIISAAKDIAAGKQKKLELGNIEVFRDWGWAPDYVDAMWRMLQLDNPKDFVIATGISHSLSDFTEKVFRHCGLSAKDHITSQSHLFRPSDIKYSLGNPKRAYQELKWQATYGLDDIIREMVSTHR